MQKNLTHPKPTASAGVGSSPNGCSIGDILAQIRRQSFNEREKGHTFERIMKLWFLTDPRYSSLTHVWLWEEFPARQELGGADLGIDIVALTDEGEYWAIQCKCYDDTSIQRHHVQSTITNANRLFTDPNTGAQVGFANIIFVDTTTKPWGRNAEETLQNQRIPVNRITLGDLEQSTVDWQLLRNGIFGSEARTGGKHPRPHQIEALSAAHKHFCVQGHSRGKLIMACGTGKTYTSLCIAERITASDSLILFLVPSIALLGQTLNAWMSDKTQPIKAICVCSDSAVNRATNDSDDSITELALPATTNISTILQRLQRYTASGARTVIFSTYQSIEVVAEALREFGREVDLCICDEAHRTTGVRYNNQDESYFTRIHNNDYIHAAKRLYMTATPRLYGEGARARARLNDDLLCSMDDEELYGQEFHRLSFSDAVANNLLCDYKVLVLTVSEDDLPSATRQDIAAKCNAAATVHERLQELNFDDATKLIGCVNGLSKRLRGDEGLTRKEDPALMRRAVVFCPTINPTRSHPTNASKIIAQHFGAVSQDYKALLPDDERQQVVDVEARHIDGSMGANERNALLNWLKEDADNPNECRVLCNVRCLSEGVDVPALDAVIFISPKNSEVEVVQSVGRVMRSFHKGMTDDKKYGYIIIPVIIPPNMSPEQALDDNERFKVVWQVLNALRSHDENFNATVNKINLNRHRPSKVVVSRVPRGQYNMSSYGLSTVAEQGSVELSNTEVARQLELQFGTLQEGIYARMVEKVGDKMYWENWSRDVGKIAQKYIERISLLVVEDEEVRTVFDDFVDGLRKNLNPSVSQDEAIEMLAQHMVSQPVFDALFADYKFVQNNSVSRAMHDMIEILRLQGFEMEQAVLDKFYTSVRNNVSGIDNLEGKQQLIKNLYEKFFKGAFPKTVDKLGIVYTPIECVDFIIHSVDHILRQEFHTSLTAENVHIIDPFTGTGTFITRLLQSGLIEREDMERKYLHEIHCNELVLLAYYIADVNIEAIYQDIMHPAQYLDYDGICLTDTFQINEISDNNIFSEYFPANSEGVIRQKRTPIRVIIGNPPYSVGQRSANDNAQNLHYPLLDSRIADTYVARTTDKGRTVQSLYDSYIKAFRWASDRIADNPEGGIVAFISNGAWIDSNSGSGFRHCLEEEFSSIYVLNLRGNQRTSGELSRKEGGKIFGSGSRTPISITLLVKNPHKRGKATIYYHDIGDYLTREDKLKLVKDFGCISSPALNWQIIKPNDKNDWINQRDGVFDDLILLGDKNKNNKNVLFNIFSAGDITHRDPWCYNFSENNLSNNIKNCIDFYNNEVDRLANSNVDKYDDVISFVNADDTKIKWDKKAYDHAFRGEKHRFIQEHIRNALYRPFQKQFLYYDNFLNWSRYQLPKLFPTPTTDNRVICVSGVGVTKDFSCIITNTLPDLELIGKSQCFPLYYYKEEKKSPDLFSDAGIPNGYTRHDGITDWVLQEVRTRFGGGKSIAQQITKERIFYYVYGLLHSPDYRTRFADDLRKSLPRIPIVDKIEDFIDFYKAGRALADLHLNYESLPPAPEVVVHIANPTRATQEDYDYFSVNNIKFAQGATARQYDKTTIHYNPNIMLTNIPLKAYDYIVNGKSAIEWIMERYQDKTDRASLIRNNPNDWSREHQQPRYILDLLLSVISLSCQSVDIIKSLPKLKF